MKSQTPPYNTMNDSIETLRAEQYHLMFEKVKKEEITLDEWDDFCHTLLAELMDHNKDVFIRLKNR